MDLFRGTEKFILWLITVGLVFLITVQMLSGTKGSINYLQWAENRLHELVNPLQEVAVFPATDEYVTLRLIDGSRPEVRVLINNEQAFSFKTPTLRVHVLDGDILIIDTRGSTEALWFEVAEVSDGVKKPILGQKFQVKDDLKAIPVSIVEHTKF